MVRVDPLTLQVKKKIQFDENITSSEADLGLLQQTRWSVL